MTHLEFFLLCLTNETGGLTWVEFWGWDDNWLLLGDLSFFHRDSFILNYSLCCIIGIFGCGCGGGGGGGGGVGGTLGGFCRDLPWLVRLGGRLDYSILIIITCCRHHFVPCVGGGGYREVFRGVAKTAFEIFSTREKMYVTTGECSSLLEVRAKSACSNTTWIAYTTVLLAH